MDYYAILEVDRDASAEEIKRSYRSLALKYHPDRNKEAGASEKFAEINQAYAVLSDAEKKAHYDQFGSEPQSEAGFAGGAGFDPFDIFSSLFGSGNPFGGSRNTGPARGEDLQVDAKITLEQSKDGADIDVAVDRMVNCDHCQGSRSDPAGKAPERCKACSGRGFTQQQQRTILGNISVQQPCHTCRGEGKIIIDACPKCKGRGRNIRTDQVKVKLPKGIDGGYRLRVAKQGNDGPGGAGDLYVHLSMKPHAHLLREEDHLVYPLNIGIAQAVFGAKVKVPTLNGDKEVEVQAGTQTGDTIRLRGLGMPRLQSSGIGDLFVKIKVHTPQPESLSKEAKEHLLRYAEAVSEDTEHKSEGFFSKLGKAFREK